MMMIFVVLEPWWQCHRYFTTSKVRSDQMMLTNPARPHEADPAHEISDLVNDNGAVVGQEKRAVCHKLGLLHRAGVYYHTH
jgi:hypothetical protein